MSFRTEITATRYPFDIDYNTKLVLLGSCFANNIGEQLQSHRFQATVNPFGTLYNPASIARCITRTVSRKPFTEKDIIFHNEEWVSLLHHSKLSNSSSKEMLAELNQLQDKTYQALRSAHVVFISLGTAWIYQFIRTGEVVANCHRMLSSCFARKRLTLHEVKDSLNEIVQTLHQINKQVQIICTVSPIRHLKDGFFENQVSKSTLILALAELSKLHYFPAYELVMDDLRDYRFYKGDMLHPNEQAVQYIWEYFQSVFFSTKTKDILGEVSKFNQFDRHKPKDLEAHKKKREILEKKLLERYPILCGESLS